MKLSAEGLPEFESAEFETDMPFVIAKRANKFLHAWIKENGKVVYTYDEEPGVGEKPHWTWFQNSVAYGNYPKEAIYKAYLLPPIPIKKCTHDVAMSKYGDKPWELTTNKMVCGGCGAHVRPTGWEVV